MAVYIIVAFVAIPLGLYTIGWAVYEWWQHRRFHRQNVYVTMDTV